MHAALHNLLVQGRIDDLGLANRSDSTVARSAPPRGRSKGSLMTGINPISRSTRRFVRHYVEMVVVMFLGMFILMAPTGWLFNALGTSWSRLSPAMNMFAMAITMTVPMVAWMRYRGHAWRANAEMAASMLLPTFAVVALLWAGVATHGALMVPEHLAMLGCMLLAMLLRRDEYACALRGHRHARPTVAA